MKLPKVWNVELFPALQKIFIKLSVSVLKFSLAPHYFSTLSDAFSRCWAIPVNLHLCDFMLPQLRYWQFWAKIKKINIPMWKMIILFVITSFSNIKNHIKRIFQISKHTGTHQFSMDAVNNTDIYLVCAIMAANLVLVLSWAWSGTK